jgi:hypothetical protein
MIVLLHDHPVLAKGDLQPLDDLWIDFEIQLEALVAVFAGRPARTLKGWTVALVRRY